MESERILPLRYVPWPGRGTLTKKCDEMKGDWSHWTPQPILFTKGKLRNGLAPCLSAERGIPGEREDTLFLGKGKKEAFMEPRWPRTRLGFKDGFFRSFWVGQGVSSRGFQALKELSLLKKKKGPDKEIGLQGTSGLPRGLSL